MGTKKSSGESFVKCPAALITELSDTALRILLYAIDRESLVKLGIVKKWRLSLADVENQFRQLKGYGRNTARKGFRELQRLGLLDYNAPYYDLNHAELKKWYLTFRQYEGMPKSGRGRLPKSGSSAVPKSGSQEKKSIEKKRTREEKANPVAAVKTPAESFDDIFGTAPLPEKSPEEKFDEMFGPPTGGKAAPDSTK